MLPEIALGFKNKRDGSSHDWFEKSLNFDYGEARKKKTDKFLPWEPYYILDAILISTLLSTIARNSHWKVI